MLTIEAPKAMTGRMIKEFAIPGEATIAALVRRGQATIPSLDAKLELGDVLHIAAAASVIPKLEKLISH
jgi:NhaP-type Na+/H+ and K+/H+ antiporter